MTNSWAFYCTYLKICTHSFAFANKNFQWALELVWLVKNKLIYAILVIFHSESLYVLQTVHINKSIFPSQRSDSFILI